MTDDLLANRYRGRATLGSGAMDEVRLADDLVLGRLVAIKKLRADPATGMDCAAIDRIVREARVAARLQHPHSVAVFDLLGESGQPYVVMEYVQGELLAVPADLNSAIPPTGAAETTRRRSALAASRGEPPPSRLPEISELEISSVGSEPTVR